MLRFTTKVIAKIVITIFLLILLIFAIEYILCPIYIFPERKPFSGNKIYNPYQNLNQENWHKANMHLHASAWLGVTNGENSNTETINTYKNLGYQIVSISDYQKINRYQKDSLIHIPCYEHGYNVFKIHQLSIGAKQVVWNDFPFYQGLNHKQHIINLLKRKSELVAIVHPGLTKGYKPNDFKHLCNYDLIEVLNKVVFSDAHWDTVLSSGYPAFIFSNDDAHNVSNPYLVGRCFTYINASSYDQQHVLSALKNGEAFGVKVGTPEKNEDFIKKQLRFNNLPKLEKASLQHDTLHIQVSDTSLAIVFYGQSGIIKKVTNDATSAYYVISAIDTYIRVRIVFKDGTSFYLNPVYRYSKNPFENKVNATINESKTRSFRIVGFSLLIIILLFGFNFKRIFLKNA